MSVSILVKVKEFSEFNVEQAYASILLRLAFYYHKI